MKMYASHLQNDPVDDDDVGHHKGGAFPIDRAILRVSRHRLDPEAVGGEAEHGDKGLLKLPEAHGRDV